MKIIFCGDRNWVDRQAIFGVMILLKDNLGPFTVIHGDAKGADRMAASCAKQLGLEVEAYPAKWNKFGLGAGPIRNTQMLVEGGAHAVVAFHPYIEKSKGTGNMVKQTRERGVPCHISTDGSKSLANFVVALKKLQGP